MRRLFHSRPSPAMVVALIALFVALGGSGYAAVQFKKNSIPGKALKRNSVTGKQVKESTLRTVPRARDAANATNAANATSAENATKFGGLERGSFVRRGCTPETGQIKGIVTITASPTFSSTFTEVPGYNCSGQTIEARRLSMGRYEIRFNGSPATEAVGTPRVTGVEALELSVLPETAWMFVVHTVQPNTPPNGAFADVSFTLMTP